jgi:hypothetical protein
VEGAIPPEIQQQIDELQAEAIADPSKAGGNASRVSSLLNQARQDALRVHDAFDPDSFQLGALTLVVAGGALLALLPGSGVGASRAASRWRWSTIVVALSTGLMVIAAGVIASTTRVRDPEFTTGVGVFLVFVGGFFFFGTSRGMLTVFSRRRVYADALRVDPSSNGPRAGSSDDVELVSVP